MQKAVRFNHESVEYEVLFFVDTCPFGNLASLASRRIIIPFFTPILDHGLNVRALTLSIFSSCFNLIPFLCISSCSPRVHFHKQRGMRSTIDRATRRNVSGYERDRDLCCIRSNSMSPLGQNLGVQSMSFVNSTFIFSISTGIDVHLLTLFTTGTDAASSSVFHPPSAWQQSVTRKCVLPEELWPGGQRLYRSLERWH